MNIEKPNIDTELRRVLDSALNLQGRADAFCDKTSMLGGVPELDSVGVMAVLTALEEWFGIVIKDEEIDGQIFTTFGHLKAFVESKLG